MSKLNPLEVAEALANWRTNGVSGEVADQAARIIREQHAENKRSFNRGYLIACCNISNLHGEETIAFDVLRELGVTRTEVKAMGLAEYDASALRKISGARGKEPLYRTAKRVRSLVARAEQ